MFCWFSFTALLAVFSLCCLWLWLAAGVVGRVSAQYLVRTDSREQKLDAFLVSRNSAPQSSDLSTISTDDAADFTTPPLVHIDNKLSRLISQCRLALYKSSYHFQPHHILPAASWLRHTAWISRVSKPTIPLTSTWPHLRCDVGLEEGEYK